MQNIEKTIMQRGIRIKRGKGFTKDFLVNLKRDPLNMNSYYISGKP